VSVILANNRRTNLARDFVPQFLCDSDFLGKTSGSTSGSPESERTAGHKGCQMHKQRCIGNNMLHFYYSVYGYGLSQSVIFAFPKT
jgi:hypothetical protein